MGSRVDKEKMVPFYKAMPDPIKELEFEKKNGRPRVFSTPKALWEKALEYFEYEDNNPMLRDDFRGKDAYRVTYEHKAPYTLTGFCLFAGVSHSYLRTIKSIHKKGTETHEEWKDFLAIIACIEETCRQQKFHGASAGIFNANIIARDLGIADIQQQQTIDEDGNPAPIENKAVVVLPSNGREVETK